MKIIAVVSMKGGVGKTSVTANLAAVLAQDAAPGTVAVLNLDPQNTLHLHFGLSAELEAGVCLQSIRHRDWREVAYASAYNVINLPYGDVNEAERKAFEARLAKEPDWIADQLEKLGLPENSVVLIDTPPGPSVYLRQAIACADTVIIVALADASSYATVPAMESWLNNMELNTSMDNCVLLLNQLEVSNKLNTDIAAALKLSYGERASPIAIPRDEEVGMALAFQQPLNHYAPHSPAAQKFRQLAHWLE